MGKSRTGAETLLEWIIAEPEWDGIRPSGRSSLRRRATPGTSASSARPGSCGRWRTRGWKEDRDYDYNKSLGIITLLDSSPDPRCKGQKIYVQGADDPDVGRGLNLSGAWLDEYAKWPYPTESWTEGILPSLRIGPHPRVIVTTTPKPIAMLKQQTKRKDGSVHVTPGSTFDNAGNCHPSPWPN